MSINTVDIMNEYVARKMKNSKRAIADDGIWGKAYEIAIRSYIMGRRAKAVKSAGKTDIRFTSNGKHFTCEIKTACGEIETAAKNQYVIYNPYVVSTMKAECQGYVLTREQWINFLNSYNGRGKFTRVDKNGHEHIQSFYINESVRPKASKAITRYIFTYMADKPTVEEFFNK